MVILLLIIVGVLAGRLFRRRGAVARWANVAITVTIGVMLFMLGMAIGNDHHLLSNLGNYGWQALLLCVAAIVGSLLFTVAVNAVIYKKKR